MEIETNYIHERKAIFNCGHYTDLVLVWLQKQLGFVNGSFEEYRAWDVRKYFNNIYLR